MSDPYVEHGAAYAAHNAVAPYNALYERPALLELAGDVAGLDVLDLGCGPGVTTAALVGRGARVTGVDGSAPLVAHAQGLSDAAFVVHDLAAPLPFPPTTFDLVVSGLVLHYLPDWSAVLGEVARVLRPGGRLVASVHHPLTDVDIPSLEPHGTYLESYRVADTWRLGDEDVVVRFFHHPLGAMTAWIAGAGLALTDLVEPRPQAVMAERDPEAYARLTARPAFLLLAARRVG
ncbi:class I SAM-dependent methyltransferase [Actinomycetospora soli]|uniref:class I SAM-dependent methyltransferase n=1 Tax=Actinomycetospora soli TaxID=2893887 RepID=UPI001E4496DD|nr:class I SAM-dependent methyltransferase [Actinomycetospora soli]MCD2187984.1 class I SAM-dependent methyltransferase [Actinomycetospora soli]